MEELKLNRMLQPDPQGPILLRREGDKLRAWYTYSSGEQLHFNPFTFGIAFDFRSLKHADFSHLKGFLSKYKRPKNSYEVDFPRAQQIEIMEMFLDEEHNTELSVEKRELFCELYEQLFPVFWRYAISSGSCILYDGFYGKYLSESYIPYQSSSTYEELIQAVFGVARKDTLREGRKIDALGLALAHVFRGLLPLDQIVQELATQEGHYGEFPLDPQVYKPLERLSLSIRRRLFADLILDYKIEAQFVQDALELLEVLPQERLKRLKGVSTWDDLHRRLMSYCDAVEGEDTIAIPKEFENLKEPVEEIEFRPLARASEFVNLGHWLHICIGKAGYFMRALRGESYCLVGLRDRKPYAALELKLVDNQWKVQQLRRENNDWLDNQKIMIKLIEERLNYDSVK